MHVAAPGSTKVPREASTRTSPRTVIEFIASLYTPKLNGLRPPLNIRSRPGSWGAFGSRDARCFAKQDFRVAQPVHRDKAVDLMW